MHLYICHIRTSKISELQYKLPKLPQFSQKKIMQQIGLPIFKASAPSFNMYHRPRTSQTVCYKKLTTLIEQRYKKLHLKDQKRVLMKSFINFNEIKEQKTPKKKVFCKKQRKTQNNRLINNGSFNKKSQNGWYQNLLKSQKIAFALKTSNQSSSSSYPYRDVSSHSITNSQFIERTMPAASLSPNMMPTAVSLHSKKPSESKFMPYCHQEQQCERLKKSGSLKRIPSNHTLIVSKLNRPPVDPFQKQWRQCRQRERTSFLKERRRVLKYGNRSQNNSQINPQQRQGNRDNKDECFGKWRDWEMEEEQDKGDFQDMLHSPWGIS